jgi:phage terminase large subunit GpA-like protein
MTGSQWADEYFWISPEASAARGLTKWKTRPYQRGILDAMCDPNIETVVVKKSARIGYTKMIGITIGYYLHNNPRNILVVQPTIEDAQGYSKDEITPALRDVPVLYDLAPEEKTRDSDNTILRKQFPGATLYIVGANSPRGFRRISAGTVIFDEISGYPPTAGKEGDQFLLGSRRAEDYWDKKIIAGSTPTDEGVCKATELYEQSDKRQYHVPCPHCGFMQPIEWERIDFSGAGTIKKPVYICVSCEKAIEYGKHRWMMERGEWIAEKPYDGVAGFYLWSAYSYSPGATWSHIVRAFLDAKDNPEKLKTWVNTWRGQAWDDGGERTEPGDLYARREEFNIVPAQAGMLIASVDVQDDRLEVLIKAWGKGEESWDIDHVVIYGNMSQTAPWDALDLLLSKSYQHAAGYNLNIMAAGIDSGGHHADEVYHFCRVRETRNIIAIKGDNMHGKPIITPPKRTKHPNPRAKGHPYMVGVFAAKDILSARLRLQEPGPGFIHFPVRFEMPFFEQLCVERKVVRYIHGRRMEDWQNPGKKRNEAWDLEVYNLSVLRLYFPDIGMLNKRIDDVLGQRPVVRPPQRRRVISRGITD